MTRTSSNWFRNGRVHHVLKICCGDLLMGGCLLMKNVPVLIVILIQLVQDISWNLKILCMY